MLLDLRYFKKTKKKNINKTRKFQLEESIKSFNYQSKM